MTASWTLRYRHVVPEEEGRREALCTLGNGYFATRGAAPEAVADGVHYPGTYLAGCYNRLSTSGDGGNRQDESLVNAPNWLPVTFRIGNGPWFTMTSVDVLEYEQSLDLERGVLHRRTRIRDQQGRTTMVRQHRFVHMAHPHLAGLRTSITAENWSGRLRVRSGIDGAVRNAGVARYRGLADRHLEPLDVAAVGDEVVLLRARTTQSRITIATAVRTRLRTGQTPHRRVVETPASRNASAPAPEAVPSWIGHDLELEMSLGSTATVDKTAAIYTSQDHAITEPGEAAVAAVRTADDFEDLLWRHELAWHHLWQRFRVELDASDVLRTVRLHVFHVLQTVSPHTADLDAGVPARGLHGEAYRGHVFWDELFVMPLLNLRLPTLARALLRYRYRRLGQARQAAAEAGQAGAMYPWQSSSDGSEQTQPRHLNPLSGRWLPDVSFRQRHVGLAVAYNVWQYFQVTGDMEFLTAYGAEMLLEIARFFASLTSYDQSRSRYVIRGVMGPDEFHTGYPDAEYGGIDNNAYTNVMTVWVLLRALDTLRMLPGWRRAQLMDTVRVTEHERRRWDTITRRMFVPFHQGVISQFEGYERLTELDWDRYRSTYPNLQRLDRILESEGDSVNRYQVSKQADALMLFYLLPPEELTELFTRLGYRLDRDAAVRTVDHHLARTCHGSTLSAVVHAWVLARAHRNETLGFFLRALDSDVADIQGGTTAEGIHLAAMAGSVDVLQRCYAGISVRGGVLHLDPYWPERLGELKLSLQYRGPAPHGRRARRQGQGGRGGRNHRTGGRPLRQGLPPPAPRFRRGPGEVMKAEDLIGRCLR